MRITRIISFSLNVGRRMVEMILEIEKLVVFMDDSEKLNIQTILAMQNLEAYI